jgi:L-ascorbate metabolism protein UlaG (beta-lactamase superfamily)
VTVELTYHGWSCFTLKTPGGRTLVFDPNWTNPFGSPLAAPEAFAEVDLCLVTHGHFDHIQDVPALMRRTRTTLVASPEVCRFLRDTHGIAAHRAREIELDRSLEWNGLRVTTFEWDHRIVDTKKMFAARPEAKAQLSGLHFSNPYDARRMGFTVTLEDGRRVTNYCEGFNDQTRFDRVRAVGDRDRPDVVVAAAQLDYPAHVAAAAAILQPRRLVLFHPHSEYFAFIGLPSLAPSEFIRAVRGAAPGVEVEAVEPGRRLTLPPAHPEASV